MVREGNGPSSILLAVVLALVVVAALLSTATRAQAQMRQENDVNQYGKKEAPKGPMAGAACKAAGNKNGVFDVGDSITYAGNFSVAPGASVVIDDTDGTVGTFVDGENATISSNRGGITVTLTGAPINVSGGDGVLNDTVCQSIVASTGVSSGSAGSGGSSSGDAGVASTGVSSGSAGSGGNSSGDAGDEPSEDAGPLANVLPSTGGPLLAFLGALAVVGTGFTLFGRRARRRRARQG